jgi:ABC-type bacteriocin/lantibiotic exporter with double-glycine peptidase domain
MVLGKGAQGALAKQLQTNARHGTSRKALVRLLRASAKGVIVHAHCNLTDLAQNVPAIVSYQEVGPGGEDHYAVVLGVTARHVVMHDPWHGKNYKLSRKLFLRHWKNPKLRKKYTGWFVAVR